MSLSAVIYSLLAKTHYTTYWHHCSAAWLLTRKLLQELKWQRSTERLLFTSQVCQTLNPLCSFFITSTKILEINSSFNIIH